MKKTVYCVYTIVLGFALLSLLNSCQTSKDLAYFSNIPRDSVSQIQFQNLETKINQNDVLQVNISTLDDNTTRILNASSAVGPSGGTLGGYLVDETGIIKLPLIGALKAAGLTKRQLADLITNELLSQKIAKDPIVTVRIINFKITVLGEVGHPGVVPVVNEKITLPEAIAQAGDLTIYGRRTNVLLIRENGGKRIYKRLSLNKEELFDKDFYNLQNQDIIYVEPNNARAALSDRANQLIPLVMSIASFMLVIYFEFFKR
jgi:polysaccharide export outer membrane protein